MYIPLILASLPALSHATYLDPSLQHQKPLVEHSAPTSSDNVVLPLNLNKNLDYTFPSSHPTSHTPLHRLQNSAAIHATHHNTDVIRIDVPLDASRVGTVSFSARKPSSTFTWVSQNPWNPAMNDVPLVDAGVRKGGTVGMAAEKATLDLSTPFISLPTGLWDVLVLATQPVHDAEGLCVECGVRGRFPDLVFGVSIEEEEEDVELVVTPAQYVMQNAQGKCVLLAKEAQHGDESVGLGWAAIRGRTVVLDWAASRLGFEM